MADAKAKEIEEALKEKYSPTISDGFKKYIDEQDFDDETIKDDLEDGKENPEDSTIIEELLTLFPSDNKPNPKKLLQSLLNIMDDNTYKFDSDDDSENNNNNDSSNDDEHIAIEKSNCIDPLLPLHKWDTTFTDKDLKYIKDLVDMQCCEILPKSSAGDKNLLIVLYLGKKHNNLPLLTYLTDSYHRYIIKQTKSIEYSTSHWIDQCKKNKNSDIFRISKQAKGDCMFVYNLFFVFCVFCLRIIIIITIKTIYNKNNKKGFLMYIVMQSMHIVTGWSIYQNYKQCIKLMIQWMKLHIISYIVMILYQIIYHNKKKCKILNYYQHKLIYGLYQRE